jgi:mucin-6/19
MYIRDLGGSRGPSRSAGLHGRQRALRRRLAMLAGTASLVTGLVMASMAPASAATATVSVSPNSNLTSGGKVTVTVTTPNATPSGVFVAVTQCGNAASDGTPLTALASDGSDCVGASGLGTTLQLLSGTGAGPGTYQTTLTLAETGMGSANAQCIAMPPATIPCVVEASTASISGQYTGTGSFSGSASITYANNVSTSTTTTEASTTSATTATTTPSSSTTTASSTSTTPTTTPTPSPTTTVPAQTIVIVAIPPFGYSATTASSTTTSTSVVTTASTTAPAASSSGTPAAATTSGSLAFTGSTQLTWVLALVALGLLDLGYLAVSATRKRRRKT